MRTAGPSITVVDMMQHSAIAAEVCLRPTAMGDDHLDITGLLARSRTDLAAREAVYELVYADLRRIARRRLAHSRPGDTLSVTSLVNEAYLKLIGRTGQAWDNRDHFLGVAANAMRQITVDYVRAKLSEKRGGGQKPLRLEQVDIPALQAPAMVLALEEGLQQLAVTSPRLVTVVECRFFAGLTVEETASTLGVSGRTVEREWLRAKEWLKAYLT